MANFTGTSGNDTLTGTSGNDKFDLSQGGEDAVQGLAGRDLFSMGAAFDAGDSLDGGTGSDVLRLNGDYSAGVVFNANTIVNIEQIQLDSGHGYNLITDDGNVAAGATLIVAGGALTDSLDFNGSDESDGAFAITAGAGNDTLWGGFGNDSFDISTGGNDEVFGGAGNDTVTVSQDQLTVDQIDGGAGTDTVIVTGNGPHKKMLGSANLFRVEAMKFAAGHDYAVVLANTAITAAGFTVDGSALGTGDTLSFDARASTNSAISFIGGAGNDTLLAEANSTPAQFDLSHGGHDIAIAGLGADTFTMGGGLDARDQIDGGGGADVLLLNGDYGGANAVVLRNSTVSEFPTIRLADGHDYDLTFARGTTLGINQALLDATAVGAGHNVTIDNTLGREELQFHWTTANVTYFASNKGDLIVGGTGGAYAIHGGDGDDFVQVSSLTASDSIDGGAGIDSVSLLASNVAVTLTPDVMANVETFTFGSNDSITTTDSTVAAGETFTVAFGTGAFDGSAETDGHFDIIGSGTVIGGALSDTLQVGADTAVTGGGGTDRIKIGAHQPGVTLNYDAVSDSTGVHYDIVSRFVGDGSDHFHLSPITTVTGLDTTVAAGALSTATFDSDLAAAVGAGQLAAQHAVLFTPTSGTLAGQVFLIVDANGTAGYQADADLVIDLASLSHGLTLAAFS
ncbi:MAG TPA: bluetail domain-containing putative surface protein [Rhizomicrobium sp.]|jgi:hypothetical protein